MPLVYPEAPRNVCTALYRALSAVIRASPEQEHDSVCIMYGRGHNEHLSTLSFIMGRNRRWAVSCLPYAARKIEYLCSNPDAVTSFEGADPDNGLYGGGLRAKGWLVAVSGLSSEADLVVGLLFLLWLDEFYDGEEASKPAHAVSESCGALFEKALALLYAES